MTAASSTVPRPRSFTPPRPSSMMARVRLRWAERSCLSRLLLLAAGDALGVDDLEQVVAGGLEVGGVEVAGLGEQEPLGLVAQAGVDGEQVDHLDDHLGVLGGDVPLMQRAVGGVPVAGQGAGGAQEPVPPALPAAAGGGQVVAAPRPSPQLSRRRWRRSPRPPAPGSPRPETAVPRERRWRRAARRGSWRTRAPGPAHPACPGQSRPPPSGIPAGARSWSRLPWTQSITEHRHFPNSSDKAWAVRARSPRCAAGSSVQGRSGSVAPCQATARGEQSSSPWTTTNQASLDEAHDRQPRANRSRSATVASPLCSAWSDMPEPTTRSAHISPHHVTSPGVEKHQTPAVADTTSRSAAWAQLFRRRPASGSASFPGRPGGGDPATRRARAPPATR